MTESPQFDIDHIVPRNEADKNGFIVKDGVRMPSTMNGTFRRR
jgi:hypothetical protein